MCEPLLPKSPSTHGQSSCDKGLSDHLTRVTQLRSSQDGVAWVVFTIFSGANIALAVGIAGPVWNASKYGGACPLAFIGGIFCVIWTLVQVRTLTRLEGYEEIIRGLQRELSIPGEFQVFQLCSCQGGLRARDVMRGLPYVLAIVWFIAFGIFLAIYFCNCH